jgi:hypothetical protein
MYRSSTSALRVAQQLFVAVTAEPTTVWLRREELSEDVGEYLPPGRLLLGPLRDLLLRPETPPAVGDVVWRELIPRARADRSTWLVVALGMAMPGLRRQVREVLGSFTGDRDDLESAVAEGFVAELYRVDVTGSALCARLVRAARRAGVKQVYQDAVVPAAGWSQFESRAPGAPWGHPDFVLLDAVGAGVLSLAEASLIGVTRLEDVPVAEVADVLGERVNTVVVRRRRAEHRLREAIVAGTVTCTPDPRPGVATRPGGPPQTPGR